MYASALNSTTSTGQGDIPTSLTGSTYFAVLLLIYTRASLELTAQSRVNMLQVYVVNLKGGAFGVLEFSSYLKFLEF